jgi:hypothetical protein
MSDLLSDPYAVLRMARGMDDAVHIQVQVVEFDTIRVRLYDPIYNDFVVDRSRLYDPWESFCNPSVKRWDSHR